jgi:hypothetical protein
MTERLSLSVREKGEGIKRTCVRDLLSTYLDEISTEGNTMWLDNEREKRTVLSVISM